jgi:GH15 family glucan-1,4-alpha-glucosidase
MAGLAAGWLNWTRAAAVRRSAITVHLLTHPENHWTVAALTTSLPEGIGADPNYDNRYTWVRDASSSLAMLACLDKVDEAQNYLDWLSGLDSSRGSTTAGLLPARQE